MNRALRCGRGHSWAKAARGIEASGMWKATTEPCCPGRSGVGCDGCRALIAWGGVSWGRIDSRWTCPATSRLRLPNLGVLIPKIWWFSAGSRSVLFCIHVFRQVLQFTVAQVTPIAVVLDQSVRVTRCPRSRCHQYRIAHYLNRLISLRRISLLSPVPAVAGAFRVLREVLIC
jgi:hypothetical protein